MHLNRYTMNDRKRIAKKAATDITRWLLSRPETIDVKNVEKSPDFQRRDIDLFWSTNTKKLLIEIKGDRYHGTGNFFFETKSNKQKGTPGCFLYTQADWLFYYFITPGTVYCLPMPATREWFLLYFEQFKERETITTVGNGQYTTVGRLVPIKRVITEVSGVRTKHLN